MSPLDGSKLRANVLATEERLAADATYGVVLPTVRSRLRGQVRSVVRFEQYGREFGFGADESVERGGDGAEPSPMRYLLTSIACCLQVWCAKSAALRGEPVERLDIDVTALLDMRGEHLLGDVPPYPRWFFADVRLSGPAGADAARDIVAEALRRCPVAALVAAAVPVYVRTSLDGRVVAEDPPPLPGTGEGTT